MRYLGSFELGAWLLAGVQHMRVLRMSHCFTLVSPFPSHLPPVVVVVVLWLCLVFPGFASALGDFLVYTSRVLDDRQCFTARSARRQKKKHIYRHSIHQYNKLQ